MRAISIGALAFALILAGCAHTRMDKAPIATLVAEPEVSPAVPVVGYAASYLPHILFERDSLTVKNPDYRATLDEVVRYLQKWHRDTLVLEGHTCDIGDEDYNLQLGLWRALVAHDDLVSKGIAPERLSVRSLGERVPAVPNDLEPNRSLNRRVIFRFYLGEYSEEEEQAISGK